MDGINEPLYPGHVPQATYDAQQMELKSRQENGGDLGKGSAPSSSPPAGQKRKRAPPGPKFYAVRQGKRPGVYNSWADCRAQVQGYANAIYKSFLTREEADHFARTGTEQLAGPARYYAVRGGRKPGVYTDWPTAQAQVYGWKGVKHKAFSTRAEAESFVRGEHTAEAGEDGASKKKKAKKATGQEGPELVSPLMDDSVAPGTGPFPPIEHDGFDANIKLDPNTGKVEYKTRAEREKMKMQATGLSRSAMLHIYTDGSSRGNGKVGARAGVGVFFGPGDQRNLAEPLSGFRQTNQRAELTAIQRALEIAPRNQDVTIFSDSNYSIKCVTEWFVSWRKNGWVNAQKKPVENRDIIEPILAKIDERNLCQAKTKFEWLKGHANDPGNEAADRLANQGAAK